MRFQVPIIIAKEYEHDEGALVVYNNGPNHPHLDVQATPPFPLVPILSSRPPRRAP